MTINKLKKVRIGNKGFSLVELIIVIAIMAILIAVLAPLFIIYVERSRQSNDINALGSMAEALKAVAIDPSISETPPVLLNLTWVAASGDVEVRDDTGAINNDYQDAVHGVVGDNVTPMSRAVSGGPDIIISLTPDTGFLAAISPDPYGAGHGDDNFNELLKNIR